MSSRRPCTGPMRASVRPHAHGASVDGRDVGRAVADQRQRLLGQRRDDELAGLARRTGSPCRGRRLDEEVVLVEVQPAARLALGRHARADDLRQPVEVARAQPEPALELRAHRLRPRLGAEQPELERQLARARSPSASQRLGDRAARRTASRTAPAPAGRAGASAGGAVWPRGDREDRRAEALGAVVEAEAAGEEPVAVGVVDEHARAARPRSPCERAITSAHTSRSPRV